MTDDSSSHTYASKRLDYGFLPLLGEAPKVLILGTLPSVKSLQEQQYYGHPRNAFWWLMSELFGFDISDCYSLRCCHLLEHNVAVWDVIASCHRPGSLDAKIDQSTLKENDFSSLLNENPTLSLIAFNGQSAHKLFSKFVHLENDIKCDFLVLPSTSPANAGMSRNEKLEQWCKIMTYLSS